MKELITSDDIKQAIINRIISGQYVPGDRLPSVRDLANELGSNRNTVNKAYQALTEIGVIETGPSTRTGFFVRGLHNFDQKTRTHFIETFHDQAARLVWQAMAGGMNAQEVFDQITAVIHHVYGIGTVNIAFYECNELDSQQMGKYLSELLHLDLYCGLIKELHSDAGPLVDTYDLIVTTFHHLAEVTHCIGEDSHKIVGIDTRLTPESLLTIARLPEGHHGVVCGVPNTTHTLKHLLHSYYPERKIETAVIDDTDDVLQLSKHSDYLITTHTCADQLKAMTGRDADVVVNFLVDDQSIQYLKQRVYEIQTGKTEVLRTTLLDPL